MLFKKGGHLSKIIFKAGHQGKGYPVDGKTEP